MLLRKFFAKKWYPMDTIFHNCCQKEYHLDYELFRDERKEKGMTRNLQMEFIKTIVLFLGLKQERHLLIKRHLGG